MFVNRQTELAFLNSILERERPSTAQLVLLYGRRRVGKTVLLRHWAEATGLPHTYWAADKEPSPLQRRKLFARVMGVEPARAPTFDTWADCWQAIAAFLGDHRHILILDEFTYGAEADPAMLSSLQHAWDQQFKTRQTIIVLCGSHVHAMETLQARQSPLFGRLTGQWHLQPLTFADLREFLPGWSAEERAAAYAVVGGVPAYLEWLDPARSLSDNIREVILAPGSMFIAEPTFLLYDEVRDPRAHLAILHAIGAGHHTMSEIANAALVGRTHLSAYLGRLRELRLVERRLPVTIPPGQRRRSRRGRYHISDPYFRFYFRFIAPLRDELTYRPEQVLPLIQEGLRPFVGLTAFEELSRHWVAEQGRAGRLPFEPQDVGSHWSRRVQIDAVAVNWRERAILLGECKWGADRVSRDVIRNLLEEKTVRLLRDLADAIGEGWTVHYAFFAHAGFTDVVGIGNRASEGGGGGSLASTGSSGIIVSTRREVNRMTHQQQFTRLHLLSIPVRLGLVLALLAAMLSVLPVPVAHAALIITVCTSGCDHTTIQAAINAAPTSATISVTDAVHTEAGITVNKSVTITGAGASSTIVQAHANENQASNRVFTVSSGVTVTIRSMTIRHGKVTGDPARGGGVYNEGTLTLHRVTVTANRAEGDSPSDNEGCEAYGGGIYNNGTLITTNSTISGNTAQAGNGGTDYDGGGAFGGGIANGHHKTLSVTSSTISGNTVQGGDGWDSYDGGDGNGGGIAQSSFGTGTLTFSNSTISGNTAQGGSGGTGGSDGTAYGGGIRGSNGMTLTNCTVASNQALGDGPQGGGLYSSSAPGQGPVIKNSIFADNTGPSDANGPDIVRHVQSQDYNLIENPNGYTLVGSTGHNVTGQDPKLSALADNGGDTQTHALQSGSPAIDAIPVISCTLTTDQRGVARPVDGNGDGIAACDIGAFEFQWLVYLPLVLSLDFAL